MLDPIDDVGQNHTGDRKDQHADEDLISLKGRACDGDHEADTRGCRIELAHHDADERTAYGQPETRQDEGYSRREYDGPKTLPFRSAKASSGGQQVGRCGLYAVSSIYQ